VRSSLRAQIALTLLATTGLTALLVALPGLSLMERLAGGVGGERLETARLFTLLYGALAALLALAIGFARLSRLIVAPIRRLRVATERVAAGDHASRLELASANEIGDLATSFNHMLDRLDAGRRALEAQVAALQAAQRELERTQRAMIRGEKLASVGRLAAGVAHEVGNPLAAVLGLVELLRDDPEQPAAERDDLLARLERELLRIHETIRNLLDYSRGGEEQITDVDAAEVVEQSLRLVGAQPRFRQVTTEIERDGLVPRVRADADRLLQVLVNLLLNAGDAMGGEGRVTIRLARRGEGVAISVADTGPGLAPEVMAHVFEPFFTTKPPGQGTGLGLAICESIVEGLGGELTVDGGGAAEGEGRGATFTVWLPAAGLE
jgi:two-component system, NtrC family, sensor kinase